MTSSDLNLQPSDKFYDTIKPFNDFSEITNGQHYTPVPDSWWIFVADIRGSTKEIEGGRYRDVNMVGAACIASVLNAILPHQVPYVFGGDGATLIAPDYLKLKIIEALQGVQKRSFEKFGLDLRVGCVSVKEVKKLGVEVEIARHRMADKVDLAMFRGGGLSKAEQLVKDNAPQAEIITPAALTAEPELVGLSCRWSAFKSTHGCILSIIVKARQQSAEVSNVYSEVISKIEAILQNQLAAHNPVTAQKLKKMGLTFKGIKSEWNIVSSKQNKWKQAFGIFLRAFISKLIIRFNIWFGPFVASTYKEEILARCDHKKFDDTLRLVLDCSDPQKLAIENYLESLHQQNEIDYGLHSSKSALMTCFVPGATDGTHIHFIDGDDGGYALAAKAMKARIAKNQAPTIV